MVGGPSDPRATSRNLRLERGDARVQLLHRKRIEVLTRQFTKQVAAWVVQVIVGVHRHAALTVGPRLSISG